VVPFDLYNYSSDHHLGEVMMKDKKSIAFYSRKINVAQKCCITTGRDSRIVIIHCKIQGIKKSAQRTLHRIRIHFKARHKLTKVLCEGKKGLTDGY
jgi:hypothetical protein